MSVKTLYLEVGFDKNGRADFGVVYSITELSYEQMNELRAMVTVAIGTMEDIWRRAQYDKPENRACTTAARMPTKEE